MRMSQTTLTGTLAAAALAVAVAGCSSTSSSSPTSATTAQPATNASSSSSSSAPAPANDYTGLLIKVSDIDAPIPFVASPPEANPNGKPGAAIVFSTEPHPQDADGITVHEVHIRDTVEVLPDPAAAVDAMNVAKAGQDSVVNPTTDAANVGSGGVTLSGKSPDGSKGVTVLLFTEGRALVTLEFEGPVDSLPPPDFVIDVGQGQAAAIKKGLGG